MSSVEMLKQMAFTGVRLEIGDLVYHLILANQEPKDTLRHGKSPGNVFSV